MTFRRIAYDNKNLCFYCRNSENAIQSLVKLKTEPEKIKRFFQQKLSKIYLDFIKENYCMFWCLQNPEPNRRILISECRSYDKMERSPLLALLTTQIQRESLSFILLYSSDFFVALFDPLPLLFPFTCRFTHRMLEQELLLFNPFLYVDRISNTQPEGKNGMLLSVMTPTLCKKAVWGFLLNNHHRAEAILNREYERNIIFYERNTSSPQKIQKIRELKEFVNLLHDPYVMRICHMFDIQER